MDQAPKSGKNRPQELSDAQLPRETAQDHGRVVGHADVCLAEPEMEKQPAVKQGGKK